MTSCSLVYPPSSAKATAHFKIKADVHSAPCKTNWLVEGPSICNTCAPTFVLWGLVAFQMLLKEICRETKKWGMTKRNFKNQITVLNIASS